MVLTICLILGMIPTFVAQVEVEANALSVSSLTCADYISNAIARSYIDTMMKYYINNYSNVKNTLTNGLSAIFMFEGGSDNYWDGEHYEYSIYDNRIQAVVFVVKLDSSGNAYIDYCSETCTSIASNVADCTAGVGYSGSTTILDGIYRVYRWDHTGPYAAFQLDVNNSTAGGYGLYVPTSVPNGQLLGCSGINIHTRSTTSGSNWSAGCQLIGTGAYTSNEFNQFFRSVSGCGFDPWTSYYSGGLYSYGDYGYGYGSSYNVGYYIVDRQLAMIGTDGQQYGTGSLNNVFNTTALGKLTSFSTSAAEAAGALDFEYATSQCTYYPAYCQIKCTLEGAPLNSQPCSVSTTYGSETLEEATLGTTYTATGLFKNHYGNYWYRVTTSSGETAYIYGGEAEYVKQITSDVKITGATIPNGHVQGATFYVNGTVQTTYNELSEVSCYIYSGFEGSGDAVTGASDTPSTNSYVLKGSDVDDATWMGALEVGNYTYAISAKYTNYYADGATTLKTNTGTISLIKDYFTVIAASTDQSTCSHSYTTTTLGASNCTESGTKIQACSTCGKIVKTTVAAGSHSYGDWTTTTEATCTTSGVKTRTCSKCGNKETQTIAAGSHSYGDWSVTTKATCTTAGVKTRTCSKCGGKETQTIAATGHSYNMVSHPANCTDYALNEYTCSGCGDNYKVYADEWTDWSTTEPEEGRLVESKTQYRYSDYETKTSNSASLSGYTQTGMEWVQSTTGSLHYVSEWPSGYDTSSTYYTKYNNTPKTASETDTAKTVINSDKTIIGYIYYHYCSGTYEYGPINRATSPTKTDSYPTFHTFTATIATQDPTTLTPADDGSVTYARADACTDSHWWYYIPVYEQTYTTYTAQYTYERWTDWSDWSDTAVTASDTRKVETRTVYRYLDGELGDHVWVEGVCSVCGKTCDHDYVNNVCTVCGMEKPVKHYALFGFINGANYGCEEDYATVGDYRFVDGKLVVKFTQASYVGIKTIDNAEWYMTDGWQGRENTSAVLYDATKLSEAEKLYVPGKVEITFTLVENEDGTVTLSYEATPPDPPTISLYGATLSFKDEIYYKVLFKVDNPCDVQIAEMGLLTWTSETDGTVENAEYVISGWEDYSASYLTVRSQAISAKKMGDDLYFKVYLKLADGTYVYSGLESYNAKTYAMNKLNNSNSSDELKALCVALLNYGAAAQEYFEYNLDSFINDDVTMRQQRLVDSYCADMLDDVAATIPGKVAALPASTDAFTTMTASVNFGGAFGVNYLFAPAYEMDGDMTLYVWDEATYDSVTTLTTSNASQVITMTDTGETFYGRVPGISAKNVDDTIYVCGVYESDGVTYRTGVLTYSPGAYCESLASSEGEGQYLAEATAVYCYYAKLYLSQEAQ